MKRSIPLSVDNRRHQQRTKPRWDDPACSDDQHHAASVYDDIESHGLPWPDRHSPSGDTHPTAILQTVVLNGLMSEITAIVKYAQPEHISVNPEMRPPSDADTLFRMLDKSTTMKTKAFGTSINALQRAYCQLLHDTYDEEYPSALASNVRNLSDVVLWKLNAKSLEGVHEGKHIMRDMLEHLQVEFKWGKIIEILEAAADTARAKKATSYREAKAYQEQLNDSRRDQQLRKPGAAASVNLMLDIANS
jgi:hypothetical protein